MLTSFSAARSMVTVEAHQYTAEQDASHCSALVMGLQAQQRYFQAFLGGDLVFQT